jgi:hypothetical protein
MSSPIYNDYISIQVPDLNKFINVRSNSKEYEVFQKLFAQKTKMSAEEVNELSRYVTSNPLEEDVLDKIKDILEELSLKEQDPVDFLER